MARLVVENLHQKEVRYDEIGLCVENVGGPPY
jgi:hypothetical protein